jgi:hypothetical protein
MENVILQSSSNLCDLSGDIVISLSIVMAGIFTIFMEFITNKVASHIYSCALIIVIGLSLFILGIFIKIFKDSQNNNFLEKNRIIKGILIANFGLNLGGLIYFCYILSINKNTMELQVTEVINTIIPYLKAFLVTIIVIIVINMNIYNYLVCIKNTLNESRQLIMILSVFSLIECIIEILFLYIIYKLFNNITDG